MPLLYGSPLPPGVEASTRGELRIRVDKLLIDDASVNRNPLVNFHFGGPNVSVDSSSGNHAISPNRFVVPVDYCAVSPRFWGEEKTSVSCQPSTAQHPRGSFTFVYPVKVEEETFQMYLKNMSASAHHGLQFEVHVPSSYSGRPPVLIGKCTVPLDSLASPEASTSASFTKNILNGWFGVIHQSQQPAAATTEADPAAPTTPAPTTLTMPIGKLKLHVHLHYFSKPARTTARRPAQRGGLSQGRSPKNPPDEDEEGGGRDDDREHARTARPSCHNFLPVSFPFSFPSSSFLDPSSSVVGLNVSAEEGRPSEETGDHSSVEVERVIPIVERTREEPPPKTGKDDLMTGEVSVGSSSNSISPARKAKPGEASSGSSATAALLMRELLRKGVALRSRMEAATTEPFSLFPSDIGQMSLPRNPGFSFFPLPTPSAGIKFPKEAIGVRRGGRDGLDPSRCRGREYRGAGEDGLDDISSVLYTSEESDEEEFMIEVQKDRAATRRGEKEISSTLLSQPTSTASQFKQAEEVAPIPHVVSTMIAKDSRGSFLSVSDNNGRMERDNHASSVLNPHKTVAEMHFTDVSFASTDMTKDLEEIRINVRLSKDITVESPASGPFSSFVHRIPLAQSTICLSFIVCFYSEKKSRLVIEFIKVKSKARQLESAVEREVLSEELLGLCIVGMFTQSRDIVLRDPVSSQTNVYCHVDLQLFPQGCDRRNSEIHANTEPFVNLPKNDHSRRPNMLLTSGHNHVNGTVGFTSHGNEHRKKKNHIKRRTSHAIQRSFSMHDSSSSCSAEEEAREDCGKYVDDDINRPFVPNSHPTNEQTRQFIGHKFAVESDSHNIGDDFSSDSHVLLCLSIHDIQGLPRVALNSVEDYTAPNSFVVLDSLIRTDGSFIEDWYLETKGSFDRTEVVYNSRRPLFEYRSVIRLPLERNSVKKALTNGFNEREEEASSPTSFQPQQRALLGDLKLTLWHYAWKEEQRRGSTGNTKDSINEVNKSEVVSGRNGKLLDSSSPQENEADESSEEVRFWSRAAIMGTCNVDLRPLKYLNQLEGYYRVIHEIEGKGGGNSVRLDRNKLTSRYHTIGKAEHETEADKGNVVGYIHIGVQLL
ncbi:unnamed protein product [Phytomonas sp. Hart1]|nr:unnamed protein product [Phytomonas sp. Hart1]|eukprot:CCW66593.1 unnamed protein product [Phytomonas sp. isolate Hart1]